MRCSVTEYSRIRQRYIVRLLAHVRRKGRKRLVELNRIGKVTVSI